MGKREGKLPANLFERDGRFYYHHGARTLYVGADRASAIAEAAEANLELGVGPRVEEHAATFSPNLVSGADIAAGATRMHDTCGIYFLLHESRIVYIGQSRHCHRRIGEHEAAGHKLFDSFYLLRCDRDDLDRLEALYIAKFRPPYNETIPAAGWAQVKIQHAEERHNVLRANYARFSRIKKGLKSKG